MLLTVFSLQINIDQGVGLEPFANKLLTELALFKIVHPLPHRCIKIVWLFSTGLIAKQTAHVTSAFSNPVGGMI